MSRYSRLGRNAVLVSIGNIGGKLISFLMLPFYTKWLSVSDYGIVDLLSIYSTLIITVVGMCISEAIFVFPKKESQMAQREYFSSGLTIVAVNFLIVAILFLAIREIFGSQKVIKSFLEYQWLIYAMMLTSFLQNYIQQFSRSLDYLKIYSISGIIQTLSIAILSFVLIPKFGVIGFVYANILSNLFVASFTFFSIRGYRFISFFSFKKDRAIEMLKYSIPLIPNLIMWWFIGGVNRPVMESNLGLEAIGLYAVAYKFPSVVAIIFSFFVNAWQISVVEEFKKSDYHVFYNSVFRFIWFVIVIASIVISLLSELMVDWFLDPKYNEAWHYIPVLCLSFLFSSFSGMVGTNFLATRESKYFFYSSVWGAVSSLVLNPILIPLWGLWGACLSVVLSHGVMALSRTIYSWKYVKVSKIHLYLIMFLLNVGIVLILQLVSSFGLKALSIIILGIIFIIINMDIIRDYRKFAHVLIKRK